MKPTKNNMINVKFSLPRSKRQPIFEIAGLALVALIVSARPAFAEFTIAKYTDYFTKTRYMNIPYFIGGEYYVMSLPVSVWGTPTVGWVCSDWAKWMANQLCRQGTATYVVSLRPNTILWPMAGGIINAFTGGYRMATQGHSVTLFCKDNGNGGNSTCYLIESQNGKMIGPSFMVENGQPIGSLPQANLDAFLKMYPNYLGYGGFYHWTFTKTCPL